MEIKKLFNKDFQEFMSEYISSSLKEKGIMVQRRTLNKLFNEVQTYWVMIKRGERLQNYSDDKKKT
tara:strand:- start:170 stop:367 length:198 start_codon:yes stop_codon:yes gene_type:complete